MENVFHYSFLVKKGEASLRVRNEQQLCDGVTLPGGPVAKYIKTENRDVHPTPKQAIVSLTMKDWRQIIQHYGIEKSNVPHRTGSKFEHTTSSQGPAQHVYEHSSSEE